MKKTFLVLYLMGVVLICALRTPIKYYQFYDRYIVIHTHIFSDKGKILVGQFVLYNLIWALFVFLVYLLFRYLRTNVRREA